MKAAFDAQASDSISTSAVLRGLIRLTAVPIVMLMAMIEPVFAVLLGGLSMGCLLVSVVFGFILRAPFPRRWEILLVSLALAAIYCVFRLSIEALSAIINDKNRT